jgi:hypothetical protein
MSPRGPAPAGAAVSKTAEIAVAAAAAVYAVTGLSRQAAGLRMRLLVTV